MFLSSAADGIICCWSLATFDLVYRFKTESPATHLITMDDNVFVTVQRQSVTIYDFNHLFMSFASTNNAIQRLTMISDAIPNTEPLSFRPKTTAKDGRVRTSNYKSAPAYARLLVTADDLTVKVLSPLTGRTLTSSMPIMNTELVQCVVGSCITNCLYMLVAEKFSGKGEVWISSMVSE